MAALAKPGVPLRLLQLTPGTGYHKERLTAYLYQGEKASNGGLLLVR